jgi:hypothetical protein
MPILPTLARFSGNTQTLLAALRGNEFNATVH